MFDRECHSFNSGCTKSSQKGRDMRHKAVWHVDFRELEMSPCQICLRKKMVRFGLYNEVPKKLRRGSSETACCFRIWIWCHSLKMGFDEWIFIHDFWWSNFGKLMKYHADHLQSWLRFLEGKAPKVIPVRWLWMVIFLWFLCSELEIRCAQVGNVGRVAVTDSTRLGFRNSEFWKFLKLNRVELHHLRRSILLSTLQYDQVML